MLEILIVEDDEAQFALIAEAAKADGCSITHARSLREARGRLREKRFQAVLLDYELGDGHGTELLREAPANPNAPPYFCLISAYGSVPRAVEALKAGALDFLEKPVRPENLSRLLDTVRTLLRDGRPDTLPAEVVCSPDSPLRETLRLASAVGPKSCPVVILGESGAGKELVARHIHQSGPRSARAFVAVNCAAIPEALAESELFGFRKGAFTGAARDHRGKLEQADGGTLFLDEVAELPLHLQSKLLRALQERVIVPLGSETEIQLDLRVVSATHRNLREAVWDGAFREDLYYRLNILPIEVPPLRDRPADIPLLVRKFLSASLGAEAAAREAARLPGELLHHPWPGNVRQLQNTVQRFAILRDLGKGWPEALAEEPASSSATRAFPARRAIGAGDVEEALHRSGGHREKAAEILGVSKRTLQYHLARRKNS